ncbi:hypothetical protein T4E_2163 [Trichinella pseudospiralis]|uniref:Uncharacterized protein n=1 Tax=Trichinella pseudospiralis TaxID=6337 RepID=A0A0V1F738_TRIPS|nr:hypothetical protein T4E_2163 [Trichinella pseudospiralis]KRY81649.1 hypothetical protein T4D_15248 [Trichinella pseudospiralis]
MLKRWSVQKTKKIVTLCVDDGIQDSVVNLRKPACQ